MRLYGTKLDSSGRLRFGRRLTRGLVRVAATKNLAPVIERAQGPLEEATTAREALEGPLEEASDDLVFAELDAESKVRRVSQLAKELDGDREGDVWEVGFPEGLAGVIAPKGKAQLDALKDLRVRYDKSQLDKVVANRDALLKLVDEATALFAPAYERWVAARAARAAAFEIEKIRRDEHRRTVDSVFGAIRAALPRDIALQNAIVPSPRGGGGDGPSDDGEPATTPDDDDNGTPT